MLLSNFERNVAIPIDIANGLFASLRLSSVLSYIHFKSTRMIVFSDLIW